MRRLSLIIFVALLFVAASAFKDSPHGKDFKVSCGECHSPDSWKLDRTIYSFNHNKTDFPLSGQHVLAECRACHPTLVFSEAKTACADCHTDVHYQTVGPECGRCHTPESWIVNNITEIHRLTRFPLTGPHYTANCNDCHLSASLLRFDPLGVECIDCHQEDYNATTDPNHIQSGFSTNCLECHSMNSSTWTGAGINHDFFPLTLGHDISNCSECHTNGVFTGTSPVCASCHQPDYDATANPNHTSLNFSTTCSDCHTTNPGWKPAEYQQHDAQSFPIYSGKHAGTWTSCAECHSNPADYKIFSCIDCHDHNQQKTDDEHNEVGGYTYASIACLECHPTGDAEGSFNHNNSVFPLTGAHVTTPCSDCHTSGYAGTPTNCSDCHMPAYNQTTNPNHTSLGIQTTCATCHTTNPGWKPASFPDHNNYYPLTGAHTSAGCNSCHASGYTGTPNTCAACHQSDYNQSANPSHTSLGLSASCETCHTTNPDWQPALFPQHNNYYVISGAHTTLGCSECHNGNYNTTANTCIGCHQDDYNQTNNPPHASAQFPTSCETCHTQNAWVPSTFNHDPWFPIYSGSHDGEWNQCSDCHPNASNYQIFSCFSCHSQPDMDDEHSGVANYSYNNAACLSCHPDGSAPIMKNPVIKRKQD